MTNEEIKKRGEDLAKSTTKPDARNIHSKMKEIAMNIIKDNKEELEYLEVFKLIKKGYYSVVFEQQRKAAKKQSIVMAAVCPECGKTHVRFVNGHGVECGTCGSIDITITKEVTNDDVK